MNAGRIAGRVALIQDEYTLVINRGAEAGVQPGMVFAVYSDSTVITDPETGRVLGRLPEEKVRVQVIDVHPLFARAETYCTELDDLPPSRVPDHVGAGALAVTAELATVDGMAALARYAGGALHEEDESSGEVVTVNVGDAVELVESTERR